MTHKHADFVHLHVHTQYSLLDGMIFVEKLVKQAAAFHMPSVAITDHGQMHGVVDFYSHALKAGVKPILGVEIYVAPGSRLDKSGGPGGSANHLTLLARDETGYRNLVKLTSAANLDGFYYKPRIDKELLAQHAAGLIALSGCMKGEVAQKALRGDDAGALKAAGEFREILGAGNYYLELMVNGIAEQEKANRALRALSKSAGIPVVATNDCHYLRQEDAPVHEVLLCISTGKTLQESDRMRLSTDQFYFRSPEEMARLFADSPEALRATVEIAERCNVELKLGDFRFPKVEVPEGATPAGHLRRLAGEGLAVRLGPGVDGARRGAYEKRLDYELGVIEKMDFPSYFLAVWDFVHYAKTHGIPVGPGRGSAAGSLAAWVLGITDIDPLQYGLLFERFLNPGRKSMPDIDIDFEQNRRDEVLSYVKRTYGEDRVAQIVTFGKLKAKAAIRDVGRVLGLPYADVDRIAKLVPEGDPKMTLEKALKEEPRLADLAAKDPQVARLIEIARSLEGLNRHASTHASGVLISPEPLSNLVPLFKDQKKDVLLTQFDMDGIEKIGLVKFDFLGLITLTVIQDAERLISARQPAGEPPFSVSAVPLDDPATFKLLAAGRTAGVFQFESSGMRDTVVKMRPNKLDDLIALNALYRPGPLEAGVIALYLDRRHGKQAVTYRHPVLKEALEPTYGLPVYQEQVMQIAVDLAGYTPSEADDLRKAMGKKKAEVMAAQREKFVQGAATKHKVPAALAEEIFAEIEKFAGYGFNKSHSAAYALIAYHTAWLKTHFPVEYMAALLTSEVADTDKIVQYVAECREMGLKVLPPDVNASGRSFTVVDDAIRFGLAAVKNVGEGAIESIVEAREKQGRFTSLFDFCARIDLRRVNKRVLEGLVKCGAFDSTGARRAQLMDALDLAMEAAQGTQRDRNDGQVSLFAAAPQPVMEPQLPDVPEWPQHTLLSLEKEAIGFYLSGHPLGEFAGDLARLATPSRDFGSLVEGAEVRVGGLVTAVKNYNDRKGEPMAFVTVEDLDGTFEVTIFSKLFKTVAPLVVPDAAIVVVGKANVSEGGGKDGAKGVVKFLADEVIPIAEAKERLTRAVHVRILTPGLERETLEQIGNLVKKHRGAAALYVHLVTPQHSEAVLKAGGGFQVRPAPEFLLGLEQLLGKEAVTLK
jgi:DNA polymerase-3 subunit alpha